ncbi:formate dehydrogenase subunit delta [Methylogaea oryzae]|uniref:NAD-dependent formate dehydrogenase n=1 Tax=Methylogaea oryzae TaxID=1295382 RepID=A0A8D4VMA5_9GAMM|nr:formate dehydrogenase subunit delta [Methylogaea oryzae]BBL70778.1 NAD-dependent formate dehydrogenase [Methylogaea oryzae]
MHIEQLVKMANDIGTFFSAETDSETAIAGVADHLKKFWDPRMRRQIVEFQQSGGAGLKDIVQQAVQRLG